MEGLVLIILFGMIVSFLLKVKKDAIAHSKDNIKRVPEDFLSDSFRNSAEKDRFQFDYEVPISASDHSAVKTEQTDKCGVKNIDDKSRKFDLKKAVIYSSVLNRPYGLK